MLDIFGGIVAAVVVIVATPLVVAIIVRGWGQWRCVLLRHRWAVPVDDGEFYGVAYRTSGCMSWRASAHCDRCDSYTLFRPSEVKPRFVAPKTWQGSAPR